MQKPLDAIKKKNQKKATKKKSAILAKVEKRISRPLQPSRKQLLIAGSIFSVFVIFFLFCAVSNIVLAKTIYPNVWVGDVDLGNKKPAAAEKILAQKSKGYLDEAFLDLTSKEDKFELKPKDVEAKFDLKKTSQFLFDIGHSQNFIIAGLVRLRLIFRPIRITAAVNFNQEKWSVFADPIAERINVPFQNAGLKFENDQIVEIPSSVGRKLEKPVLEFRVKEAVGNFKTGSLNLPLVIAFPSLEKGDTLLARKEAERMISEKLFVVYKDKRFTVLPSSIASWIRFVELPKNKVLGIKTGQNLSTSSFITSSEYTLKTQLDEGKINEYVDSIAGQIDVAPQNATLSFSGGGLKVVSPSVVGRAIDREKLFSDIQTALKNDSYRKVTIKITTTVPEVREDNLASLGIVELISEGTSSFAGSPRNRVHNIKTGASKFNGVLIKPGGIFSFNENLGPVGPETGYLPELVIKERKTIPEYGGGLCQVSTTTFRAALLSGLPILDRRPHAYRVRYYDWPYGPGVDATVYQPWPDLRFKNDTGNWILVQARTAGSKLIFAFYGTKGGRTAEINKPQILYSNPDGSMATVFTRTVFENGKLVRTDTFKSRFKSPALFPKPAVEAGAPAVDEEQKPEEEQKPAE